MGKPKEYYKPKNVSAGSHNDRKIISQLMDNASIYEMSNKVLSIFFLLAKFHQIENILKRQHSTLTASHEHIRQQERTALKKMDRIKIKGEIELHRHKEENHLKVLLNI